MPENNLQVSNHYTIAGLCVLKILLLIAIFIKNLAEKERKTS